MKTILLKTINHLQAITTLSNITDHDGILIIITIWNQPLVQLYRTLTFSNLLLPTQNEPLFIRCYAAVAYTPNSWIFDTPTYCQYILALLLSVSLFLSCLVLLANVFIFFKTWQLILWQMLANDKTKSFYLLLTDISAGLASPGLQSHGEPQSLIILSRVLRGRKTQQHAK